MGPETPEHRPYYFPTSHPERIGGVDYFLTRFHSGTNFTASSGVGYPLLSSYCPRIPDIDFIKVILLILNFEYFLFCSHKYNN
jgi:hypothetical protein